MEYLIGDKQISNKDNSADCRVLKYVTDVGQSYVTIVYRIKRTKTVGQVTIFKTKSTSLDFLFCRLNKRGSIIDLQRMYTQTQASYKRVKATKI